MISIIIIISSSSIKDPSGQNCRGTPPRFEMGARSLIKHVSRHPPSLGTSAFESYSAHPGSYGSLFYEDLLLFCAAFENNSPRKELRHRQIPVKERRTLSVNVSQTSDASDASDARVPARRAAPTSAPSGRP